jgi:hypothetical protein
VWKYRYKKQKLWKNLEKKYGEPVLEESEWPEDDGKNDAEAEDHDDLDEGEAPSETKEEPDL